MKPDPIEASSPYSVRASTPEDGPAIVALMAEVGLRPNVEPRHLHWRYWQEREDSPGPRSYVVSDGSALLAHAALIPLSYEVQGHHLRMAHLIDWAARPGEPGTGAMLLRHAAARSDAMIGIGGSEATLKILPLLGFKTCGSVTGYVHTLRPLKLIAAASQPSWRLIPRIARSAVWCTTAPRIANNRWRARRIPADQLRELAPLLAGRGGSVSAFERSDALLRYMLSCPIVPMECFVVEQGANPRGYFILAFVHHQARLVDARVDTDAPADWRALIHCAVLEAKRDTAVAELATWGSDAMLAQVLEECGFHARFTMPFWARSRKTATFPPPIFRVQMLDSDAAYLHQGRGALWA